MNARSKCVLALAMILVLIGFTAQRAQSQAVTTLHSFCSLANCLDGEGSEAGLVQGKDGDFYGTTTGGGAKGSGTVFKVTPSGTLTTLYSFCSKADCVDGVFPNGGLVQGSDGNFYGTTAGSNYSGGTIFKITSDGALTTLYKFCSLASCADGSYPVAGLIQATDGNLYGTTYFGGANVNDNCTLGCGSVFMISLSGALSTLYSFCSTTNCTDGAFPRAGLVEGADGSFYGTTYSGGATKNATECPFSSLGANTYSCGTIFKITPSGTLTTLYSFCSTTNCTDGAFPIAGLIQANDSNFYGTTSYDGNSGKKGGTVFQVNSTGTLKTLHGFCSQTNCSDGENSWAGLIQAADGNLYGTTAGGGSPGGGTIFQIAISGTFETLYSFCSQPKCANGATPYAGLVQGKDGNLFGTTYSAGANGTGAGGTVFKFQFSPTVTPAITGTLGTDGWYVSKTTTLTWTVTGLPTPATSGCSTVYVPQAMGKTYTCSATNSHGSARDAVTIKEDSVAPQVTVSSPVAGATYSLNKKVVASYSCLDATSGVAKCSGTVKDGASINTSSKGTKTFTVTGTDKAGNHDTDSFLYSVN